MKNLALDLGKFNTMCCFIDTKMRQHTFQLAVTERNYLSTISGVRSMMLSKNLKRDTDCRIVNCK